MKSITTLSTLAALLLATNVQANQDVSGFYIGAGVGSTDAELEQNSVSVSPSTDGSASDINVLIGSVYAAASYKF